MASSPTLQDPDPNSPSEDTDHFEQPLPDNDDTKFPKTLTLEIPNPQEEDDPTNQNQEEFADLTAFSPTSTAAASRRGGGGRKSRKANFKRRVQVKKAERKLETLSQTLNPIPFVPSKTLDFASHEALLKKLGLWDFVHLQFDTNIRVDLLAQLIAGYNPSIRASYVNEVRIMVNRTDLGRALKLPVKKDKGSVGDGASEFQSAESIGFIEELVSNWILLHEDTWLMPPEILNWIKMIKEGNFEKLDWAGMVWYMAEKELTAEPSLGNCYYASHLQCLIKCQREELLKEETVKMEIDVKDGDDDVVKTEETVKTEECVKMGDGAKTEEGLKMEDDVKTEEGVEMEDDVDVKTEEGVKIEEDVKMGEEFRGKSSVLEEHTIELSLGGMDNAGKEEEEKQGKENLGEEDVMDFEERKEEDDQDEWGNISMDGHFLQPCSLLSQVGGIECEEERKRQDEVEGEEEEEEEGEGKGREEGEEEEAEEEVEDVEGDEDDDDDDVGFHISGKENILEGVGSENLLDVMGTTQVPFSSGIQIHNNASSGEFLFSRVDTDTIPGGSSLFGSVSGSKRVIEHLESDIPHHSLNGNKRMRSDGHWDARPYSDFDMFEEDMRRMMGKARMMMEEKERASQNMNIQQQQVLFNELEQREHFIQQLQKAKQEEYKKSQMEIYRLDRELSMMGDLLDGYRKALKETNRKFAEYRAKCQLPEEPIYKDTGSGGLVLSTAELEKQRLKEEEEERSNCLLLEKLTKEFEAECIHKFEGYENDVKLLADKLLVVGERFNVLKEKSAKQKVLEMSECVVTEDCIPVKESIPTEEVVSAEECVSVEECVSAEGSVPVVEHAPAEECVPTEG